MAAPPRAALVSAEELLHMPDDDVRRELDEGELIEMSPPGARHGQLALVLGAALQAFTHAHHLGDVFVETGYVLARHPDVVRAPDVSFLRAARLGGRTPEGFIEGAPDLAIEIASPSESAAQLVRKIRQYLRRGAHTVWVVDPRLRTIDVYRPGEEDRRLGVGDTLTTELLPGWSLPVGDLFSAG